MTEVDAVRFPPVFAADTDLQVLANAPTKLRPHLDQFANTSLVKRLERVNCVDTMLLMGDSHLFIC